MTTYACAKCGLIGDTQPCIACGAPVFDLASAAEIESLRFTLNGRMRLRMGLGAGIGGALGFAHDLWLRGDASGRHPMVMIAWAFAMASLAALVRPRAIAQLDTELASRTGRATVPRRAALSTLAIGVIVIVVETALSLHHQATTIPRRDAEHHIVKRTCELAASCSSTVLCMGEEIRIDLKRGDALVERSLVDDCLHALAELERTHAVCDAPAPAACTAISATTIPVLLRKANVLKRDLDRTVEDQLQRSIDRAPAR